MTRERSNRAVIWDMDGVIADTGPYHLRAWQKVFRAKGVNFTGADFQRNFGQRNDTIIRNTLGNKTTREEIEVIARDKESAFRELVAGNIKPFPGVIRLITSLREHGFKTAVASSAPIENIRLVTGSLDIYDFFDSIVTGRDVTEGKPSPQGFLLAVRKLGVAPGDCVVIEDAVAGVAAAKRAGMQCIAVTNTHPREKLLQADLVVDSLEEVTIADIERLLKPDK